MIRYYDIKGHDYTELLEGLNLDSYENIELSTLKFMDDYPELMEKYDIRDQYELHNLLRKIVPDGSYHDFTCGKMPIVKFGIFDRGEAVLNLIIENAPISQADLLQIMRREYGFEAGSIPLKQFDEYYNNYTGEYTTDQKVMPVERRIVLQNELTEDFYYFSEIKKMYHGLYQDADPEEINSYNLKLMGFVVLSNCAVQNYPSLEAYFEGILKEKDIVDIAPYRKRLANVQGFSAKIIDMKKNLEIFEFEPNRIISFGKLEQAGVSKTDIYDFCDDVYNFVDDGSYFSIQSIKQDGFESVLFDLGFSDWFYASLLRTDDRFANALMFGNIILYKGNEKITIQSFEVNLIRDAGSIDRFDLVHEMENRYGCSISDVLDVAYKVQGTEIYYDKILDRFYANEETYYRELDAMEEF